MRENETLLSQNEILEHFNPLVMITSYKCKIDDNLITVNVIRDDMLIGGTKQRAAYEFVCSRSENEIVYAGPATGFAQLALAFACCKAKKQFIGFMQGRQNGCFPITEKASTYGANITIYSCQLIDVQSKAEEYAATHSNAFLCPFGLECDEYREILVKQIKNALPENFDAPKRIWLAVGSGTLLRALASIWTETIFMPVRVGKRFWEDQFEPSVWKRLGDGMDLEELACKQSFYEPVDEYLRPPYPSVNTYDAKVWQFIRKYGKNDDYIWNVAKDPC